MDQKSLKIDKKGLNMNCRYKRYYVVFLYISFSSKKLSVDEDVCVLIDLNISHTLYSVPARAVFLPKCNKIEQKVLD